MLDHTTGRGQPAHARTVRIALGGAFTRAVLACLCLALLCDCTADESPATTILHAGGARLEVTLPDGQLDVSRQQLLRWIQRAADAVTQYYGQFPVPRVVLNVREGNRSGVRDGMTYPRGGGLIIIHVGRGTRPSDLDDDWMLTHEMIHLAFPSMGRSQHWIEEGISTYVEPIARVQAGQITEERMWHDIVRDMPQGQPEEGDQGLDRTHSWGRTYWGGALFCLAADVQIRQETQNRKGLQDALRAIRSRGGVITEDWDIERALSIGDEATGTHALLSLYRQMSNKPVTVDLASIWRKLGIEVQGTQVRLQSSSPMSDLRKSITSRSIAAEGSVQPVGAHPPMQSLEPSKSAPFDKD